jgi:ParB-like chromosome segregation protein Spo0J
VTDIDRASCATGTIPDHPLARLFPLLRGTQFRELVEDIRARGLKEPIVLLDGMVLDGRNRMRACIAAGVPYRTASFEGPDPAAFVISANLRRRHLNTSQRSMVAAELANMRQGARTDLAPNGAMSQGNAAKLLNVGRRSVQRAVALRESADPAVVEMVKRGEMTTAAAAVSVKLPEGSGPKIGIRGNRDVPAAACHPRPDSDGGVQAESAEECSHSRRRTTARRPVIQAVHSDLFPDIQREFSNLDAQRRNKRIAWIHPTDEEQLAQALRNLTSCDDWLQVFQELRAPKPKGVIEALKRGPMLRIQG